MTGLFAQLLAGLTHAMLLFLIASGLSLIFGVARIINFAHGAFFMLAAYLTATLTATLPLAGASFYAAALLATGALALLGGLVEVGLLRRIYRAPELYQLLLTFALVLLIGDGVKFLWGAENRAGPQPGGLTGAVHLFGLAIPSYDLMILAAGPAVAAGLWLLLTRTRWGRVIRAVRHDAEMVGALGWNSAQLFTSVFVLGSGLAGLAGALQAPRQALNLGMDGGVIVEAFVVVVVGGMGSVLGALLGAILLGVTQAIGLLWFPRELHLVLSFVLMAAVLTVRPRGLCGRPETLDLAVEPEVVPPTRPVRWPPWIGGVAFLLGLALVPLVPPFAAWVLVEVLAFAVFAASLQFLVGTGGMLSFGHAAYFGLGAYAAALLSTKADAPMVLAFGLAPIVAAAGAVCFGAICVRARRIAFAMLTLSCAQVMYAVAHQWYDVTGGDNGILGVWPAPWLAAPSRYLGVALGVALLSLGLLRRVERSPFGVIVRAARDHSVRCEALGISVRRHQLAAFGIAGLCAGVAGTLFVFLKGSAFPEYLAIPMSVEGLIMVLLGGIGSLGGAVLGAGVFTGLNTVIAIYVEYWQAVLGILLLLVVLIAPRGLLGLWTNRRVG
jgi:branched-chain amino acid transport system permease protein